MLEFLKENYLLFDILSLLLLFAIIGFFARNKKGLLSPYDSIKNKNNKLNAVKDNMVNNVESLNQNNQNTNG